MKEHKESTAKQGLFLLGTQPIMNIMFPHFVELPLQWNSTGLGGNPRLEKKYLDAAKILHWNGARKPWLNNGLYKQLWSPYFDDQTRI